MSGVERDAARIHSMQEVFTPTTMVDLLLSKIPSDYFKDPMQEFIDPTCGDGQFLAEVLIRKLENGISFANALSTIFGADIQEDNIVECRERLLCGQEQFRHIVEKNIVVANALEYNFTFGEEETFGNGLFTVEA